MERPGRSARPDCRRRRTGARRAGPEAHRAGVWQCPPAVDGLTPSPQMSRVTLRERFFPLHQPGDVERFLSDFPWCVIFKAGTSDKTFDAWAVVQDALEPRADVAVGFVRLPEDRAASDRVSALAGVVHRSPQLVLFQDGHALSHLDEFAIVPDQLVPVLRMQLPADVGPPVRNEAVVTLEPYRVLLSQFLQGQLPEERFQWGYLERLAKEALWRV